MEWVASAVLVCWPLSVDFLGVFGAAEDGIGGGWLAWGVAGLVTVGICMEAYLK